MAIIDSMTPRERRNPDLLKASRKRRIASGSGTKPEDINKLLKMHRGMADMMKAMSGAKRGPMAGLAQMMGFGGGMPSPGRDAEARREDARRTAARHARRGRAAPENAGPAAEFPRRPLLAWARKCPALAAFRALEKRNSEISNAQTTERTTQCL